MDVTAAPDAAFGPSWKRLGRIEALPSETPTRQTPAAIMVLILTPVRAGTAMTQSLSSSLYGAAALIRAAFAPFKFTPTLNAKEISVVCCDA